MDYRFHTADVFTDRIFGGNPLAVFPAAAGLTAARMQAIAREFNLSETAFVLPAEDPVHTARLRIFTPFAELPFAGHPTVGTAHVLASLGHIPLTGETTRIVFEEGVGPVPVTIRAEDGRPVFCQLTAAQAPEFGPEPPPAAELAAMLSLEPADIMATTRDRPRAVSCGVPFLFLPLSSRQALARAAIRRDTWERILAAYWAPWVFLFSYAADGEEVDLHARMLAPVSGIVEDPATGAAATALGGYLAVREDGPSATFRWLVEQGADMGRPSRLFVEADVSGGQAAAIRVGGSSVMVSQGTMTLPE